MNINYLPLTVKASHFIQWAIFFSWWNNHSTSLENVGLPSAAFRAPQHPQLGGGRRAYNGPQISRNVFADTVL